ncbi:Serpin B3 [Lamellibrachia satsuma]|nr:Serpin B3 [Lamellibrachia satsuma]
MAKANALLLLGAVLAGLSRPGLSLLAMDEFVAANNDFAMDLYGQIRSKSLGENIFFSPFSVSSALAMVYAGAEGNTKTEMGSVLKLGNVNINVNAGFRQLFESFNDPTNNYTLSVANAFFGRRGYPFLNKYLTLVSQFYYALLKNMEFAGNPEGSRLYINDWVANSTNQKIKDLLPQGSINAMTAAVLVNTIYFKGLWMTPFDVKDTISSTFHLSPTKMMKTKMMNLAGEHFQYAEVSNLDCKILELPYVGDEVSMYILLPNTVDGLAALEAQLTSVKLRNAISSMQQAKVDVSIPKFKMTLAIDLNCILKSMGMSDLFVSKVADLSGIDGTRNLFVSKVVHKAYIDVNEEGTEAAAATGIVVGITSVQPRPKIFKADHPFLFFIREKVTGSILFSGRVVTPPKADGGSPGTGSEANPSWCKGLSKWVCDLLQWFGSTPSRRERY